jgi:hypothetical protein
MLTPERIQTEDPSLVRDMNSKALLCTDASALERHRRKVARSKASSSELAEIRARQDRTDQRLDEIVKLLHDVIRTFSTP